MSKLWTVPYKTHYRKTYRRIMAGSRIRFANDMTLKVIGSYHLDIANHKPIHMVGLSIFNH